MKFAMTLLAAAAVAAAIAMSAGSATALVESGTTACKFPETRCLSPEHYPAGTVYRVHMPKGSVTTLTGTPAETSCEESDIEGEQENTGGANEEMYITLGSFTFKNCNNNCTVTVLSPGTMDVNHILGGTNGSVTITGFKIKTVCSGIECIYSGNVSTGIELKGGSTAKLVATKVPIPRTGGSGGAKCGTELKWDGPEYEFTSPEPLYFSGT